MDKARVYALSFIINFAMLAVLLVNDVNMATLIIVQSWTCLTTPFAVIAFLGYK